MLDTRQRITVGLNLPSAALGAKDLIKVENTQLTADQANQLALFAPQATVNIIEDFKVVTKQKHEQYIAEVQAELSARLTVKRKSTVVKNNTNVKYILACTRLNERGQPYQFYTTFKTCTEKEALKTLQALHVKKTSSGDASYHSYSLYRPNYMPTDLVKTLENPIKVETKLVDNKTKLAA